MELRETLRRRKMVRAFDPRPVPPEVVDRVLWAASRAPSAGYTQGNEFLVLDEPESVTRFFDLTVDQEYRRLFEKPPPVVVLPLSHKRAYLDRYAEPDKAGTGMEREEEWPVPYWDVDAGMAAMAMLLAAVDEGLGGWLFGLFGGEQELLRAFGVPEEFRPIGVIGIGYPAAVPGERGSAATRRRRRFVELIHRNGW